MCVHRKSEVNKFGCVDQPSVNELKCKESCTCNHLKSLGSFSFHNMHHGWKYIQVLISMLHNTELFWSVNVPIGVFFFFSFQAGLRQTHSFLCAYICGLCSWDHQGVPIGTCYDLLEVNTLLHEQ